jgi:hypothetical protein
VGTVPACSSQKQEYAPVFKYFQEAKEETTHRVGSALGDGYKAID